MAVMVRPRLTSIDVMRALGLFVASERSPSGYAASEHQRGAGPPEVPEIKHHEGDA